MSRRAMLLRVLALVGIAAGGTGGCITHATNPAATRPATALDARTAHADYWWAQPAVASVTSSDFQPLWDACRDAALGRQFTIDRMDYRDGLMTTQPLTSKQLFEFWRTDVPTFAEVARSSLLTERRTIQFQFFRRAGGAAYTAFPRVLIERHAVRARRITNPRQFQAMTSIAVPEMPAAAGSEPVPTDYWYVTGRDHALEQALAQDVSRRISDTSR